MRCPTCNKAVEFAENPYRPFCSERCKTIDLGKWAGEIFRIPKQVFEDEDESSDVAADDIENSSET